MYESIYNIVMDVLSIFKIFSGLIAQFRKSPEGETFAKE